MAKILIVEDYPDLCEFLTLLLQMNGFEVQGSSSREDLFKQLETFTPDLILLDVMLGSDNGRDICKELKAAYKGLAIILISANPKLLVDQNECSADGILEKPFNNKGILQKIRTVLETAGEK